MLVISQQKKELILKITILCTAATLAFCIRLFSVIRFESVIHEFDPYFNFRTTKYLVENGFYDFHNWFDDRAWYPLGRIIGGTIYPGLMLTSAVLFKLLHFINITIDIRNVCVFLAPVFSSFTVFVTYKLTGELFDESSGLLAAALIAIVPGYISRSVAGSYDNEGIAIFCMILTYYLWIKSVRTGSVSWATICALSYFYMVSSWGGYVFLINLIPLHCLTLMVTERFSNKLYIAYSTVYIVGTFLSMQIAFVGFAPVQSSEHMAAFGVFGLCQLYGGCLFVQKRLTQEQFWSLFKTLVTGVTIVGALAFGVLTATGKISPWTGRFYSLLDPSYAKNNIPIIASVSEHQPTAWSSYYFDLQLLVFMFPVGLYYCFRNLTDVNIFAVLYGVTAIYFSGVMVRLMLVLAPIMCILSGIGMSCTFRTYFPDILADEGDVLSSMLGGGASKPSTTTTPSSKSATGSSSRSKKTDSSNHPYRTHVALAVVCIVTYLLGSYALHCVWVTSEAYSSPSIVLAARRGDGSQIIFDDFREAYYWLRMNTPEDSKVMSWWDYGYQLSAMANRTVICDNNTWNNSHISRVGQAMASSEDASYAIMRELDVDYVLVIFGGLTGYSSDDINKFLWMVRIGGSIPSGAHIKESDYFTPQGEFRVDRDGSPVLLNCMMYKMCYYKFGQMYTDHGKSAGFDRVRGVEIGNKNFEFETLEEAFTSEHWIVRIYKVKKLKNRGLL